MPMARRAGPSMKTASFLSGGMVAERRWPSCPLAPGWLCRVAHRDNVSGGSSASLGRGILLSRFLLDVAAGSCLPRLDLPPRPAEAPPGPGGATSARSHDRLRSARSTTAARCMGAATRQQWVVGACQAKGSVRMM